MTGRGPRVYLTGADGMFGTAFAAALRADPVATDWALTGVSKEDFDIADRGAVRRSVEEFRPDVVVHAAAHAIVDDCEADPRMAMRVNVAGTRNVADTCARIGCRMVYLSSDYVFDGVAPPAGGYREVDAPSPVSIYGLTKLAGERITQTVRDHLVVRTSWLFGGPDERTDSVLAMLRQVRIGRTATMIDDQFSRPTYTVDLARAVMFLLAHGERGTVHAANRGTASWFEVAQVALAAFGETPRGDVRPIALADCGLRGGRPRDSTLSTERLSRLGHPMAHWADAIERFSRELTMTGTERG